MSATYRARVICVQDDGVDCALFARCLPSSAGRWRVIMRSGSGCQPFRANEESLAHKGIRLTSSQKPCHWTSSSGRPPSGAGRRLTVISERTHSGCMSGHNLSSTRHFVQRINRTERKGAQDYLPACLYELHAVMSEWQRNKYSWS